MAKKQCRNVKLEERRKKVAELYIRSMTEEQVADKLGCSRSTIHRDIQAVRAEWRAEMLESVGDAIAVELSRIEEARREAWAAWEESVKKGKRNSRFLTVVLECGDRIAKLLGLNEAEKIQIEDKTDRASVQQVAEVVRNDPRFPAFIQARGSDDYAGTVRQGSEPGTLGNGSSSRGGQSNGNGNGNGAH
jgi:hypothetical protein